MYGNASRELAQLFQKNLGAYLNPVQFSIETSAYPILGNPSCPGYPPPPTTCNIMQFISAPTQQATSHVKFIAGHMPTLASDNLEVALTQESATKLNKAVGSIMMISLTYYINPPTYLGQPPKRAVVNVPVHVVGIFAPPAGSDPYWHGRNFLSYINSPSKPGTPSISTFTGLVSSEGYLAYFSQLAAQPQLKGLNLEIPVTLYWYYSFNAPHLSIYNLDDIIAGVYSVQVGVGNSGTFNQAPYLSSTKTLLPSDILQQFKDRVPVAQVPTSGLLFLVLGLVLFFVIMMADHAG